MQVKVVTITAVEHIFELDESLPPEAQNNKKKAIQHVQRIIDEEGIMDIKNPQTRIMMDKQTVEDVVDV